MAVLLPGFAINICDLTHICNTVLLCNFCNPWQVEHRFSKPSISNRLMFREDCLKMVSLAQVCQVATLIARFMGPTWGPSGTERTQVGPMLAPCYLRNYLTVWSMKLAEMYYEMDFYSWITTKIPYLTSDTKIYSEFFCWSLFIPPTSMKLKWDIMVSHCPPIHPSVGLSMDGIVSALYLLQYWLDPFHIYIFYQATCEGVLCVNCFAKNSQIIIFTPQPLRAPGYCRRPSGRVGGRQGRQAPLTLSCHQFFTDHFKLGRDI